MNMKMTRIAVAVRGMFHNYAAFAGLRLGALALEVEKIETITDAAVRSLYKEVDGKWKLDVTGIEDTSQLKSALQKERDRAAREEKTRKELETKFKDIDPEKVRELMAQFEDDDEAKLLAKGKEGLDALMLKKTEKMRKDAEKLVADAVKQRDAEAAKARKYMDRVLDNAVRAATSKAGVHSSAVDDALLRARSIFTLNEDGEAVQVDKDGGVVLGKDGKNPFTVVEWLEGMKESAPHWFPASSTGGGAGGNKGSGTGGKTMKRAAFEGLDAVARHQAIKDKVQIID